MTMASHRENVSPLVHRLPLEACWCVCLCVCTRMCVCAGEHVSVSWYILSRRLHLSCSAGRLLSSLCGLDGWALAWMSRVSPGCHRTPSPTSVSLRSSTRTFSRTTLCSGSFKFRASSFSAVTLGLKQRRPCQSGTRWIYFNWCMHVNMHRSSGCLGRCFPVLQIGKVGKSIFKFSCSRRSHSPALPLIPDRI